MADFNDYVYPGSNLLRNKLNIRDFDTLKSIEEKMALEKLMTLYFNPIDDKFDVNHLKKIHLYLFGDLYEFAGKYRDVEMFKEQTSYLDYRKIETELPKVLEYYKNVNVITSSTFEIALFLAKFYRDIIYVHPFRDGNSRTTREFIREYVKAKFIGLELDYSKMDKENFRLALKETDSYSINTLAYEFYKAITKIDVKTR